MKNIDTFVNDIIREAFTSGDRANTTPNSNGLNDKGGTARQMLSGEWFGSVAWPFDQATSKDFSGSTELQLDQSKKGQGELVGGGSQMESTGKELVDSLLEDSPSYIYSNPETVGYLINALKESFLTDAASLVEDVCENPSIEKLQKLIAIAEELNKEESNAYFVESILSLVETLTEEDEPTEDDKVDDGSQEEDSEIKGDEIK